MFRLLVSVFGWAGAFLLSRQDLALEILALRQQVLVLKGKIPRPTLGSFDRLFWVALRHVWSRWTEVLVVVRPETVVSWHRAGFRLYWRFISHRADRGRPRIIHQVRKLIQRTAAENPTWGAPRIHGELLKLGLEPPCPDTIRKYRVKPRGGSEKSQNWLTFLRNHVQVSWAMDFFTVVTRHGAQFYSPGL